jgi:hypothetical protein
MACKLLSHEEEKLVTSNAAPHVSMGKGALWQTQ